MFTGIVERTAVVRSVHQAAAAHRLLVDADAWPPDPHRGESISLNGCCLTLVESIDGALAFDVIPQTLARTVLGAWRAGTRVNVERSATVTTLLGGHLVQGHVDGVGRVRRVDRQGEWRLRIAAPDDVRCFLVPRGSVAVDGVSLTIAAVEGGDFEVCLIPETLERTTLGTLEAGASVNLEADAIAKLVDASVQRIMGRV